MKKYLLTALAILIIAIIFLALGLTFPIYARALPLLLIVFVIDGYLWISIRRKILDLMPFWKFAALIIYWLPLILLISCIIAGFFISFAEWNIPLRTLVPGFIFIFYTFKILPFIFQLIRDILRLFRFGLLSFNHGGVRFSDVAKMKWLQVTGWITGTIFLILMIIGMIWWNYDFRVKQQVITLPELPESFDGLRIVQISDIHTGSWLCKQELRKAVALINAQHADVIFFTGDMVNYTTLDALPFEEILSHLKAPFGILAILGNHDYGAYVNWPSDAAKEKDKKDLYAFYHRLGWKLLLNAHTVLKRGNDSIAVLGVHNWGKGYRFQKLGDIPAAQ
jgi:hypothetical protein